MKRTLWYLLTAISLGLSLLAAPITTAQSPTPGQGLIAWTPIETSWSEKNVLKQARIQALAVSPQEPAVVYAGTALKGLFKSTDGGDTWHKLPIPHPNTIALAVEAENIYLATGGGIFTSSDAGESWQAANAGLGDNLAYVLLADPHAAGTVYAGTDGKGVLKSTDGGGGWIATGLTSVNVLTMALDPQTSALYVGTIDSLTPDETKPPGGKIFKSTDDGQNWEVISEDFARALAVDPQTADLYVGIMGKGILKSKDGGLSWSTVSEELSEVIALAAESGTIYAGTSQGAFKSTDGGASWTAIDLKANVIFTLALDRSAPGTLYAGTLENGVFKSADGGAEWVAINKIVEEETASSEAVAIAVSPLEPQTVCVATKGAGVFKSVNGGLDWQSMNEGLLDRDIRALVLSESTLYVGTEGGGVFTTEYEGMYWKEDNQGLSDRNVRALALDAETNTLYAGTWGGGVFKNRHDGTGWQAVNEGLGSKEVQTLAVAPGSETVYAGTGGGVFKSTDGGEHWSAVNEGLTNTSIRTLALAPRAPDTIYAGVYGGGVFRSGNGGAEWQNLHPSAKFYSMLVDPLEAQVIYAGTGTEMMMSGDGGATWEQVESLGQPISYLALAPSDPQIVYAAGKDGLLKGTIDRAALVPPSLWWKVGIISLVVVLVVASVLCAFVVRYRGRALQSYFQPPEET